MGGHAARGGGGIWSRARCLAPALGIALVALVIVGGPAVRQGVLLPTDLIYLGYPWRADAPNAGLDAIGQGPLTDTVDYYLPARAVLRNHALDGELALWDPYLAGGSPGGAIPSSGFYNPMNLPYLLAPLAWAPALAKLIELVVAMGFTYLFARQLSLSRMAGFLAGVVYALSGFPTMWTNWPQSQVAALIPAVLWATENVVQRRTWRSTVPLSLVVGSLLLAGFPAVASHGLLLAGAYGCMRLGTMDGDWRARAAPVLKIVAANGLGLALAAFAFLPFAAGLGKLGLEYREQTPDSHLPAEALVTTISEKALGLSNSGGYVGSSNQVEVVSFIGAGALVLAALALILRPPRLVPPRVRGFFVAGLVVIAVPLFFGGPVLAAMQAVIPTFDMNPIGRARAVLALLAAVAAAIGLDALRTAERARFSWLQALGVGICLASTLVFCLYRLRDRVGPSGRLPQVKHELVVVAVFGAVVLALAVTGWVLRHRPRWAIVAVGALVLLTVSDSARFARSLMPRSEPASFYPQTEAHRWLSDRLGSERFASDGLTMYPNTNSMFGLRSANAHTFHATTWKEALIAADPDAFSASPTFSQLHATSAIATSPVFDRLAVRYFVVRPTEQPFGTVEAGVGHVSRSEIDDGAVTTVMIAGPARGVMLPVATKAETSGTLRIAARDAQGDVFWTASRETVEIPAGRALPIPVPAEAESGSWSVDLSFSEGASIGLATTGAIDVIRASSDGLRLAYADDVTIYERLEALPRIRWAERSRVTDEAGSLAAIVAGVPDDSVVLPGGPVDDRGGAGTVEVLQDGPDQIRVRVGAVNRGHLVVADALQSGWVAEVDGRVTTLLDADHAGVAVPVPEGTHEVVLSYRPRGRAAGVLISWIAGGVLLVLALASPLVLRRRR